MSELSVVPRAFSRTRPMLVFISDIHLTDELGRPPVPWADLFERFWNRIAGAKGDQPAQLCIVGDFVDIVRSPRWLRTEHRPYHGPSPGQAKVVDEIVAATIAREQPFFDALRAQVQAGNLKIHYLLGNHDRLMAHSPAARRRLWRACTGEDRPVDFPTEIVFAEHGVLAYHGHTGDFICSAPEGRAPLSDMFGAELIVRFPDALTDRLGEKLPHIDDIDDVRPIYAVPAWIRQIGEGRKGLMRPVAETWSELVEEFLEIEEVKDWVRSQRTIAGFNPGARLQTLLHLSTGRIMAHAADKRLTRMFKFFQEIFDGRFAGRAAERLRQPGHEGLSYVINGHSHFASMTPLGDIQGTNCCYFNSGTWRTLHQIGTYADGRPTFMPIHAMTYIVFFPGNDPMKRNFEWWNGAMVTA